MIYILTKKQISNQQTLPVTLEILLETLNSHNILAIDCETTGTNPTMHKIIMLQLGTETGDQYIIDGRDYNIELLKPLLENPNITFIGHNIKYDYNMLKQYNILLNRVYDTMVTDQVIHNGKYNMQHIIKNKRFSLQGVYKHYFKIKIEKDVRAEFVSIGDKEFTIQQILYGANDVKYPFEIRQKQLEFVYNYNLHKAVDLENKFVLCLGDIEYNGILVDLVKWNNVLDKYRYKLKDTLLDLDNLLISEPKGQKYKIQGKQLNLFGFETTLRESVVNWKSNSVVLQILKDVFNITPTDKYGKASSSKTAIKLLGLEYKHKIVDLLLTSREEEKILNSFGLDYINKHIDYDGKIRTNFNQIVATGRISSRNPNLQQIPNTDDHRSCFISSPGYLFSACDYSQQESRIMADFSVDQSMIKFFNEDGADIHSFVATKMYSAAFKKEFIVTDSNENKAYRQIGKTLNFSISYGAGPFTLARNLKISEEEAKGLIKSFYTSFPNLKLFIDGQRKFGIEHGYIVVNELTGMRRWFPEKLDYDRLAKVSRGKLTHTELKELTRLKGLIERRSQNSIIQGSAGTMTKIAAILIRKRLLEDGIKPLADASVKLVNLIHDEIIIEAKEDLINKYSKIQKDCMEKAGTYICKRVHMTANAVIAPYWAH